MNSQRYLVTGLVVVAVIWALTIGAGIGVRNLAQKVLDDTSAQIVELNRIINKLK